MSVRIKRPVGRPSFVQQMTEQALENIALDFIEWLEVNDRVATGESSDMTVQLKRKGPAARDGIGPTIEGRLLTVDYIDFAFFGRPAGKFPPPEIIERWLLARGITPKGGDTLKRAARKIAWWIGERGTRATRMSQGFQRFVYAERTQEAADDFAPKITEQTADELVAAFVDRTKSLKNIQVNVSA